MRDRIGQEDNYQAWSQGSLRESDWEAVTGAKVAAVGALVLLTMIFFSRSHSGFLPIIDHVNLAFHEAGHIFFSVFGKWTGILGGTLGQLIMPLLSAFAFWRKGHTASYAVALIWFFENFINIARYVADARAHELPLVGGGDHDWLNLLMHWNLLEQDLVIANWLDAIARLGMLGVLLWISWRWYRYPS